MIMITSESIGILQSLVTMKLRARRKDLMFQHTGMHGEVRLTPEELDQHNAEGRYIWGPPNWTLEPKTEAEGGEAMTRKPIGYLRFTISDSSPIRHKEQPTIDRIVTIQLTPEQLQKLELKYTDMVGGFRFFEQISNVFWECRDV